MSWKGSTAENDKDNHKVVLTSDRLLIVFSLSFINNQEQNFTHGTSHQISSRRFNT